MGYSSKDWIALKFNEDYESMHEIGRASCRERV